MSDRSLLLQELAVLDRMACILRELNGGPPLQAQPAPQPAPAPGSSRRHVVTIPVGEVIGPDGARAPVMDLSAIAHLVEGGPEKLRDLEQQLSQVWSQIPSNAQPGQTGKVVIR